MTANNNEFIESYNDKAFQNDMEQFLDKILRIDILEFDIPIYGKLIEVKPFWIVVEKKNGKRRMISKARIIGIEPVWGHA
jgi:hypothetical protein